MTAYLSTLALVSTHTLVVTLVRRCIVIFLLPLLTERECLYAAQLSQQPADRVDWIHGP